MRAGFSTGFIVRSRGLPMFEGPPPRDDRDDEGDDSGDIARGGDDFISRHLFKIAAGIMIAAVVLLYVLFPAR